MQLTYLNTTRSVKDRIRALAAISFLLATGLFNACKKNEVNPPNPVAIIVLNATTDAPYISVVPSHGRPYQFTQGRVIQNDFYNLKQSLLSTQDKTQSMMFFAWPDTLAKDEPVIKTTLELERGALYSMILYGSRSDAKYMLHKDEIPRIAATDSVTQIRFANFSEEQSVSVNLKDNPAGSFIQELPSLSFSAFKPLPVQMSVSQYELEIRDASTGILLLTYPVQKVNEFGTGANVWLYIPNTFVLTGQRNGSGATALKVTKMNHR